MVEMKTVTQYTALIRLRSESSIPERREEEDGSQIDHMDVNVGSIDSGSYIPTGAISVCENVL